MKVGWSSKSLRAFKRLVRRDPQLRILIEQALRQLASDPFHLLFEFVQNSEDEENVILLLNLGTHDEVY